MTKCPYCGSTRGIVRRILVVSLLREAFDGTELYNVGTPDVTPSTLVRCIECRAKLSDYKPEKSVLVVTDIPKMGLEPHPP